MSANVSRDPQKRDVHVFSLEMYTVLLNEREKGILFLAPWGEAGGSCAHSLPEMCGIAMSCNVGRVTPLKFYIASMNVVIAIN